MDTPITLTIAGSDSGGGAGIQADIKAISATGGYACSVITALTAQNTQGVSGILPVSIDFVNAQLDAVYVDLKVQAVKIGMLADSQIIRAVTQKLKQYQVKQLVLDPVMVATSGDLLLESDSINTLKQQLLPLADIVTPNLPEAAALLNVSIPTNSAEMQDMIKGLRRLADYAKDISGKYPWFLLKGGHLEQEQQSRDLLITPDEVLEFSAPRVKTRNTHGTGCTLSSAIASYLAQGYSKEQAVTKAKSYISNALKAADQLNIGSGHGPVNHFFMLDQRHD